VRGNIVSIPASRAIKASSGRGGRSICLHAF